MKAFKEIHEIGVPHVAEDVEHAWHLHVIQLDLECLRIGRDEMIDLLKQQGIGTSVSLFHYEMILKGWFVSNMK